MLKSRYPSISNKLIIQADFFNHSWGYLSPLAMVLMRGGCDYSDERDGEYHAGEQRDSLCVWQLPQRHQHRHIPTIRRQVRPPHS